MLKSELEIRVKELNRKLEYFREKLSWSQAENTLLREVKGMYLMEGNAQSIEALAHVVTDLRVLLTK